ncbi:hypothetical protein ACS0TY_016179 [Phlomoides rotata]
MEENKNQFLHPRKLNLNVPPLSTRRPSVDPRNGTLTLPISKSDATNMVPFSWERIPGKPKDRKTNDDFDLPPTPRPPPGWREPPPPPEEVGGGADQSNGGDDEYGHDDRFSDAIDIFSLAESMDDDMEIDCKATKGRSSGIQTPNNEYGSPSFIIERFLPDARALAEASVTNNLFSYSSSPESSSSFSRAVSIRRSNHSFKGCGLGSFLPWRMKSKPCVKSPVCDTIIGTNLKQKR